MENIRTFDLLTFEGTEVISKLIANSEQAIESSGKISHVGLVLEGKYLPKLLDPSKIYVWESTISSDAPDIVSGKYLKGVQIRDLDLVISKYKGRIGCYKLLKDIPVEKVAEMVPILYEKYKKVPYVTNPFVLVSALFCCLRPCMGARHKGMFCSEFVGTVYKHMGIVDVNLRAETIVPVDFVGIDSDGMEKVVEDKCHYL